MRVLSSFLKNQLTYLSYELDLNIKYAISIQSCISYRNSTEMGGKELVLTNHTMKAFLIGPSCRILPLYKIAYGKNHSHLNIVETILVLKMVIALIQPYLL